MAWVYILICRDKSFYTGSTRDLIHRFGEHVRGEGPQHTRRRRPVHLAWAQEFERIDDAYVIEHQIKGWSRQKKIALIEGKMLWLYQLSRMGIKSVDMPISDEARSRIESYTASLRSGKPVGSTTEGFDPAPVDAITKQTARPWVPRSQRFSRLQGPNRGD